MQKDKFIRRVQNRRRGKSTTRSATAKDLWPKPFISCSLTPARSPASFEFPRKLSMQSGFSQHALGGSQPRPVPGVISALLRPRPSEIIIQSHQLGFLLVPDHSTTTRSIAATSATLYNVPSRSCCNSKQTGCGNCATLQRPNHWLDQR